MAMAAVVGTTVPSEWVTDLAVNPGKHACVHVDPASSDLAALPGVPWHVVKVPTIVVFDKSEQVGIAVGGTDGRAKQQGFKVGA